MTCRTALALVLVVGCGGAVAEQSPATTPRVEPAAAPTAPSVAQAHVASVKEMPARSAAEPGALDGRPIVLPGASAPSSIDLIALDRERGRVWLPVATTASVDVLDIASGNFTRVDGFKSVEREVNGKKRTLGPSAAAVGDRFVYIANRASQEVCPVDASTLKLGKCLALAAPTDAITYVAATHEVWVTMPKARTIAIVDATKPDALALKATIKLDGEPECFAVDDRRGLVFTNLEDKGTTLAIDVKSRKVTSTWSPACDADGPRGVAFDAAHDFVVVACTDHLQLLDSGHDGVLLGKLETGAGVDNIDFVDGRIYVAAGKAAKLTIARVDEKGEFAVIATAATSEGVRNAVADAMGNVYAPDARGARVLVFRAPQSAR